MAPPLPPPPPGRVFITSRSLSLALSQPLSCSPPPPLLASRPPTPAPCLLPASCLAFLRFADFGLLFYSLSHSRIVPFHIPALKFCFRLSHSFLLLRISLRRCFPSLLWALFHYPVSLSYLPVSYSCAVFCLRPISRWFFTPIFLPSSHLASLLSPVSPSFISRSLCSLLFPVCLCLLIPSCPHSYTHVCFRLTSRWYCNPIFLPSTRIPLPRCLPSLLPSFHVLWFLFCSRSASVSLFLMFAFLHLPLVRHADLPFFYFASRLPAVYRPSSLLYTFSGFSFTSCHSVSLFQPVPHSYTSLLLPSSPRRRSKPFPVSASRPAAAP